MQETYDLKVQDLEEEKETLSSEKKILEEKFLSSEAKIEAMEVEATSHFTKLSADMEELKRANDSMEYELKQKMLEVCSRFGDLEVNCVIHDLIGC